MSKQERIDQRQFAKEYKARLTLRAAGDQVMDYESAVMCLKDSLRWRESLPFNDPAKEYFIRSADNFFKLCSAHAVIDNLGAKDHLESVNVIFSYNKGKVTEEAIIWVPLGWKNLPPNTRTHILHLCTLEHVVDEGGDPAIIYDLQVVLA